MCVWKVEREEREEKDEKFFVHFGKSHSVKGEEDGGGGDGERNVC